jgi:hypothetical protein
MVTTSGVRSVGIRRCIFAAAAVFSGSSAFAESLRLPASLEGNWGMIVEGRTLNKIGNYSGGDLMHRLRQDRTSSTQSGLQA